MAGPATPTDQPASTSLPGATPRCRIDQPRPSRRPEPAHQNHRQMRLEDVPAYWPQGQRPPTLLPFLGQPPGSQGASQPPPPGPTAGRRWPGRQAHRGSARRYGSARRWPCLAAVIVRQFDWVGRYVRGSRGRWSPSRFGRPRDRPPRASAGWHRESPRPCLAVLKREHRIRGPVDDQGRRGD
jgi:hypothetical protein